MLHENKFNQDGDNKINNKKVLKEFIDDNNAKLQLREEQLDIVKRWIKTGEVDIQKEVLTEEKSIIVPITREELVIRKKALFETADEHTESIRIPVSEERIEVIKHMVVLEDVSIYKRKFEEIQHVEETIRKERAHIEPIGNSVVIDKEK